MNIKGIVFDKDGVLFDYRATWETWAARLLSRLSGGDRHLARQMGSAVGFDLEKACFERDSIAIAGTNAELAMALSPYVAELGDIEQIINSEAVQAPQVEVVPLVPLFRKLKAQGFHLGVATNDAEVSALAHLDGVGARSEIDFLAGYDSGFGGKPDPGQILGFCEKMRVRPDQTIMVGDSHHDMAAAQAAGVLKVAVLTGIATHDDLAPHADVVLPNIGHLPDWLNGLTQGRG